MFHQLKYLLSLLMSLCCEAVNPETHICLFGTGRRDTGKQGRRNEQVGVRRDLGVFGTADKVTTDPITLRQRDWGQGSGLGERCPASEKKDLLEQ